MFWTVSFGSGMSGPGSGVRHFAVLCYHVVMIRVDIAEAKAGFSRLLKAVRRGESVIICERNVAVAEFKAIPEARRRKRPLGPARPDFEIPPAFFEPLAGELARAFEGPAP